MATPASGRSLPFFPKADAAVLSFKHPPITRPETVGPIYDPDNFRCAIKTCATDAKAYYPSKADPYAPSTIPTRPNECVADRYLRAFLADNERLRLSNLWYYTRDILSEAEFLSGLQAKARLAQESTEWEFVVIGLLDVNYYVRLATVGLPLAILPRGETICAHTVTQPPGSVFLLPNLMEDWRFSESPYVESGGLRAYAGVPLRLQSESGDTISFGSLCVASSTSEEPLTKTQQHTLAHIADWVVSDLVQCARVRRQRDRRRMADLLATVQADADDTDEPVLQILQETYPDAAVSFKSAKATHLEVDGRSPVALSELEDGLWEDTDYIDDFIINSNHQETPTSRVVRILSARFESASGLSVLTVASSNFRLVFDDVDLWFVQTCARMLTQKWHKRLLAEAMRAKEKFLRGFSHQLRTPVHGILGSVELLAEELMSRTSWETDLTNTGAPYVHLDTIKVSGRDLISIINSMITLNRWADIAMKDRTYATYTLAELEADLAKETFKTFAEDRRYQPSIFFKHSIVDYEFRMDHSLLQDSLLPLIFNAVQNTPHGIVTITMSICPETRELAVDIEDTGHGIHADHHKRIFEPYEKVGEHSTGAGLGLTLATKFATLLNGSVVLVSSVVDGGSHFRATLKEVECLPLAQPAPPLSDLRHLGSRFHYMPVGSDNVSLSDCFSTFLTQHGFSSSDSLEECFVIVDFVSDPVQRHAYLSQVPSGQVAICLVPPHQKAPEQSSNVVYVTGPFHTSAMGSALAEADRILSLQTEASLPPSIESLNLDSKPNKENESSIVGEPKDGQEFPAVNTVIETVPTEPATIHVEPAVPIFNFPPASLPTALLVDDNVINLRIMQMYCTKRKLPFFSAADGKEAVEIFSKQQSLAASGAAAPIQLILMDLQMPVCDGLEATRQIRALEKTNHWSQSALFMVTGQDDPSDRTRANEAGADDYLIKPVPLKVLDRNVKQRFPDFTS